ncbi:MAG: AAA family ATPase, partial [Lysobacter sp.]
MRKVKRIAPPRSLSGTRLRTWVEEITGFYARPASVRAGLRPPFEHYDPLLLGEETIETLRRQFAGRCAYCESLLQAGQGQIEQFRPSMAAADPHSGETSADHYSWFAYEWRNLMWACRECASAKRNFFPLSTPRARPMTAWRETVAIERPLLIDPCRDDPTRHLWFMPDGGLAPLDDKGRSSIEVLQLNRRSLLSQRKDAIEFALATVGRSLGEKSDPRPAFLDAIDELAMPGAMLAALDFVQAETMKRLGRRVLGRLREDRDLARLQGHAEVWQEESDAYLRGRRSPVSVVASESRAVRPRPRYSEAVVESIRISDFKAIDQLQLEFAAAGSARGEAGGVMLLGENAAGKSSVMQALALALMDESGRKNSRANGMDFAPRERASWDVLLRSPTIEVRLSSGETRRLLIAADGRFRDESTGRSPMVLGYGARRFFKAHHSKAAAGVARSLFDPFAVLEDPAV